MLRAVLFDSGGVLLQPIGGRWNPRADAYHRVLLCELGIEPTEALLADLKRPVEPSEVLETFPDVLPTLRELRRMGIRMAVVSDAWPNLPDLHAGLGIGGFFETHAISAVLGCRKPDPRMYRRASSALGYAGRALCRIDGSKPCEVPAIATLDELPHLFKTQNPG